MTTINLINKRKNIPVKGRFMIMAFIVVSLVMIQTSCKKWIDIPPPAASLADNSVFSIDATAIAVLNGIYKSLNERHQNPFQGRESISLLTGLSSDELTLHSGVEHVTYLGYYKNKLSINVSNGEHWNRIYPLIYRCNAAMEGLTVSTTLTPTVKQQLLGEAKFMRAFFYFYLVNLYGNVPLAITTDPKVNTLLARAPQVQVYQQIIADLEEAKELLTPIYLNETLLKNTSERVRPTKWAATALLARAYLYKADYGNAEAKATEVITNTGLFSLPSLNNVFQKNSREAIWQIQPTSANFNTEDAITFIIPATGPSVGGDVTNPVYLSDFLLNSFEAGDQRAVYGNWIDATIYNITSTILDTVTYAYKYKVNFSPDATSVGGLTEYFMMLRLAEQYLIRAEARAQQGNIGGAQNDLNEIRTRAGLDNTTAADKTSLLAAILHERQVELFTELGQRWFDLKRMGTIDAVMSVVTPLKASGSPWQSYQQLYPLSFSEMQKDPNLVQNTGY